MRALILTFLISGVCVAGVIAALVLVALDRPYRAFAGETFVEVPKGAGVRAIARRLVEAGVIRGEWQLLLASTLRRKPLQAGEYRFHEAASVWEVFDRIARGDTFFHEVVIPEGSNIFDIAKAVERTGIIRQEDFLKAARDPKMIRDLNPKAPSLEGFLFPAVYQVTRKTTAAALCREMTGRFRRVWQDLSSQHQKANVHETVTLASLVEKETGIGAERPLVSSVFRNRLREGMPLQCDPTTIYAALLEGRFRGAIHQSDLDSESPYNTYRHAGLPPGPIANPGRESLKAALAPADSEHLYFVAKPDGSGGHVFSSELSTHNAAVREYRRASEAKR